MSGRPKTPILPWAEGNYPAGSDPWSGTAKRQAPPGNAFTPGTPAVPQHVNYVIGQLSDAVNGAFAFGGTGPALNWGTSAHPGSGTEMVTTLTYMSHVMLWVATYTDTTSGNVTHIRTTGDLGKTWTDRGSRAGTAAAAVYDPATGNVLILFVDSATLTVMDAITLALTTKSGAPRIFTFSEFASRNDNRIAIIGSDTVDGKQCAWHTDDSGTTWTRSVILPTSSSFPGRLVYSQMGGRFVGFLNDDGTGNVFTSTDGVTWSTFTPNLGSGTNVFRGVAYDDQRGHWVLSGRDNTSGLPRVWTSPDLYTWTLVSNTASPGVTFFDIDTMGSLWLAPVGNSSTPQAGGYLTASTDGGVTWYRTETYAAAPFAGRMPTVYATNRFAMFNGGTPKFSQAAGFLEELAI